MIHHCLSRHKTSRDPKFRQKILMNFFFVASYLVFMFNAYCRLKRADEQYKGVDFKLVVLLLSVQMSRV